MKTKTVLKTVHGSWLYGLATPQSDYDYYEIFDYFNQRYRPKKQSSQHIIDNVDEVRISLEQFKNTCFKGVPQAVEVLFSPPEAWIVENNWLSIAADLKAAIADHMPTILSTYKRTAFSFFLSTKDKEKKRRHAFRLLLNAGQLKETGSMNARLNSEQIELINKYCTSYDSEKKFKDLLFHL